MRFSIGLLWASPSITGTPEAIIEPDGGVALPREAQIATTPAVAVV
jgi:hypothetical protein